MAAREQRRREFAHVQLGPGPSPEVVICDRDVRSVTHKGPCTDPARRPVGGCVPHTESHARKFRHSLDGSGWTAASRLPSTAAVALAGELARVLLKDGAPGDRCAPVTTTYG